MAKGRFAMRLTQLDGTVPLRREYVRPLQADVEPFPVDVQTLYDRHGAQCFTLALHLLAHDRRAAEDVVHDVFVVAWRAEGANLERRGSVHTWFMQTTRRICLDHIRRRTRTAPEAHGWTPSEVSTSGSESSDVLPSLSGYQVRAAVNKLPVQQQEVVKLAAFYGLTRDIIAVRTGLSPRTVEEYLRIGLRTVHDAIG